MGGTTVAESSIESGKATFKRLREINPHLESEGPWAWPLKLNSLMRDEYDFFRGTADLFYVTVRESGADWLTHSAPQVLLHGDVHLGNIGTFQGPGPVGRDIHFGLIDLDEAVTGPYSLDLIRAATALRFAVASRQLDIAPGLVNESIVALCAAYADALRDPPDDRELALRHVIVDRLIRKARSDSLRKYVNKFAEGNPLRFRSERVKKGAVNDIMHPTDCATRERVIEAVWWYITSGTTQETRERYRFTCFEELQNAVLDVASWIRVGSSGSQGLTKYLVLLDAPLIGLDEPIILQLKFEPVPAATRADLLRASPGPMRAAEVADASRLINPDAPWLVGFTRIDDRGFLVKTKDPWGEKLSSNDIHDVASLMDMARLTGTLLGRSHHKSWEQSGSRELIEVAASDVSRLAPLLTLIECSGAIEFKLREACRYLSVDPAVLKRRTLVQSILR